MDFELTPQNLRELAGKFREMPTEFPDIKRTNLAMADSLENLADKMENLEKKRPPDQGR